MKKLALLLAVLMFVMSLAACADNSGTSRRRKNKDKDDDAATGAVTTAPTTPTDPTGSTAPTEPSSEPTTPTTPQPDPPYMDPLAAAHDATGGYLFMSRTYNFEDSLVCIDSNGYIRFELEGNYHLETQAANDAVILNYYSTDTNYLYRATDGTLLYDPDTNNGAEIIVLKYNGHLMLPDNFVMVVTSAKPFQIGFLSAAGQWIQPLSENNPFLSYLDNFTAVSDFRDRIYYLGEGILAAKGSDDQYYFYNIRTNQVTQVQANGISSYDLLREFQEEVHFVDGYCLTDKNYLYRTDGYVEKVSIAAINNATRRTGGHFDPETQTAYFLYYDDTGIFVADQNGNVLQRHDGYQIMDFRTMDLNDFWFYGFAEDGLSRLLLKDSSGSTRYTVINHLGEFLFEPVLLNPAIERIYDPDGNYIRVGTSLGSVNSMLIDYDGNIRINFGKQKITVKNRIAYCEGAYIDMRE